MMYAFPTRKRRIELVIIFCFGLFLSLALVPKAEATSIPFTVLSQGEFYWNSNRDVLVGNPTGTAFYDDSLRTLTLDIVMTGSVGGFNGRNNAGRGFTNSAMLFQIVLSNISMLTTTQGFQLSQGDNNLTNDVRAANGRVTQGVHTGLTFPLLEGPHGRDLLQSASLQINGLSSILTLCGVTTAFRGGIATDHPIGAYTLSLALGTNPRTPPPASVPEPATLTLFGGSLCAALYRKRKSAQPPSEC